MEFGFPLMHHRTRKILVTLALFGGADFALADEALVLVTSAQSSIPELNSLDIRKLYLGFNVRDRSERQIVALTNASDDRVMTVFLQNVMAMTQRAYNRRLLTLAVQSGRARPRTVRSLDQLHQLLLSDQMMVTCMWKTDADKFADLKVLRVLWTE